MPDSNFSFLRPEWPDLHDEASKAEGLAYPDARTACFHARRGLGFSIELQREFARRVTAVEALKTAQRASLAELDALFATLQHRAFRGEL